MKISTWILAACVFAGLAAMPAWGDECGYLTPTQGPKWTAMYEQCAASQCSFRIGSCPSAKTAPSANAECVNEAMDVLGACLDNCIHRADVAFNCDKVPPRP